MNKEYSDVLTSAVTCKIIDTLLLFDCIKFCTNMVNEQTDFLLVAVFAALDGLLS